MSVTFKGKEVKVGDILYRATALGVSEDKIKKLGPKTVEVVCDSATTATRFHVEKYFSSENRRLFWEKSEANALVKLFDLSVVFNEIKGVAQDKICAGKMDEETIGQIIEKAEEIFASLKSETPRLHSPNIKVTVDVDPSVTEEQLESMVKDLKTILEKQRVQTQWHVYSQDPSRDKWPVAILEDKDEAIQYVKERIRKDILAKNIREYELREGWKPRGESLEELEPVMETFDASEFFNEDGSPMEIDVWCEGEWRYTIAPVPFFKKKGE